MKPHAMPETVVVSPRTGSFATIAMLGVSCRRPPKGIRTVAAPMVESKRSERPLFEATLRSHSTERMRSSRFAPSQLGW